MICIFDFVLSFILASLLFELIRATTDMAAETFSWPFWAVVAGLFVLFYGAIKLMVRRLEQKAAARRR
ncbi:MAG: hypothetical protein C0605_02065 [Hyphomicrobiales bacterium]|nr:MAG: hypothetical protein C0605_02065 [Hyphomicrobiales bacterium]